MSRLPTLAARNVARNRRRTAITLAAILLGVAAVVTIRGFAEGFITLMVEDMVLGRSGALQVHRKGYVESVEAGRLDLDMPQDEAFVAKLRAVPGVTGATGRIQFAGLVSNGVAQTMFAGRGIDLATEREVCPRSGSEVAPGGAPLSPGDHAVGLVGKELAASFGAVPAPEPASAGAAGAPGEARRAKPTKDASSPREARSGNPAPAFGGPIAGHALSSLTLSSSSPKGRANSLDVRVKGLTSSGLPFENKRVVTVPLGLAQELVGLRGRVTEYAVGVRDLGQIDRVKAALEAALGPEYEVHTWQELQPFIRDIINRQRYILGMVSAILVVITLTGIVNTMLMSVFERVREIGTMLAVGVRRRQVMRLFLLEAAVIGVLGGIGGGLLGKAITAGLAFRGIPMKVVGTSADSVLRPSVDLGFIAITAGVAIVVALVAALYPAWKASRLDPVEALRST